MEEPVRYVSHARKKADDLLRDENGNPKMSKPYLRKLCMEMKQYGTPELNDQLYLHFKGFSKIENLDEYVGLRCLWLEGNGIRRLEGLDNLVELRGLYCQQNCIEAIENIGTLTKLDTLNLSNNGLSHISGLQTNSVLSTLIVTHNRISTIDGIRGLLDCPSLRVVDLSHNSLDDPECLEVFAQMKDLHVLNLMGNKLAKNIPHYRKTLIHRCKNLTYLDDRPVFPKDRAMAEAFCEGGRDAERAARERFVKADRDRMMRGIRHLEGIAERARARRDADKSDSEAEAEDPANDVDHSYEPWQISEANVSSVHGQRLVNGQPAPPEEWQPAPAPQVDELEEIKGPKAADIDLFGSDDEFDELDEPAGAADEPLLTVRSTARPVAQMNAAQKPRKIMIEEVGPAEVEDDIAEEIVTSKGGAKHWYSANEVSKGDDAPPDLERVDLSSGAVLSVVGDGADADDVQPVASAAAGPRRPLIEVIGGDDDELE